MKIIIITIIRDLDLPVQFGEVGTPPNWPHQMLSGSHRARVSTSAVANTMRSIHLGGKSVAAAAAFFRKHIYLRCDRASISFEPARLAGQLKLGFARMKKSSQISQLLNGIVFARRRRRRVANIQIQWLARLMKTRHILEAASHQYQLSV